MHSCSSEAQVLDFQTPLVTHCDGTVYLFMMEQLLVILDFRHFMLCNVRL